MAVPQAALITAIEALVNWGDPNTAILATAIAGAENGFTDGPGDPLSILPPQDQEAAAPYACNGFTSFGRWQVNAYYWAELIGRLSGLDDPCQIQGWLANVGNNALVARQIWDLRGFWPWTTYREGQYQGFIPTAAEAVREAQGGAQPPVQVPLPPVQVGITLQQLQEELQQEASTRQEADSAIDTQLTYQVTTLRQSLEGQLDTEIQQRGNMGAAIDTRLTNEVTQLRQSLETQLDVQVRQLDDQDAAIDARITQVGMAEDQARELAIGIEVQARTTADQAELQARQEGDTAAVATATTQANAHTDERFAALTLCTLLNPAAWSCTEAWLLQLWTGSPK